MSAAAAQSDLHAEYSRAAVAAAPWPEQAFRFGGLTVALLVPALICLCIAFVAEPDIWWHMSSGEWILQHHAFPHVDTFSSTTAGHPWQAYSWLFEVLLAKLYGGFGLLGVVAYTTAMVLAITAALFHLAYGAQKNLRVAIILTLSGSAALLTLFSPRPWHFTILFFAVEVTAIQKARRTGNLRPLFLLPLLFAFWANLHIQFIDGLLLLALLLIEALTELGKGKYPQSRRVSPQAAGALLLACAGAALVNPYGWRIYAVARDLASQHGVVNGIEELKAMAFRAPSNFVVLFLALAAVAVLARKSQFCFFETAALVGSAVLAFHSQRDIWILVIISIAILADNIRVERAEAAPTLPRYFVSTATVAAALLLVGAARLARTSDATLRPKLEAAMPAQAAAFVADRHLSGPVFCDFIWGGYLIHSLGQPVSIDGRAALHGDEQLDRSARTWAGAPDWSTDPQLASAKVVIAPVSAALTQLLRSDPRFERVYEDKLAAVFLPVRTAAKRAMPLH